ncbi:unnamed protein product [Symbiodinium sp. CCMP2592]|nr:unnamed protein product [Symbiodinium sp. CCMP2592]
MARVIKELKCDGHRVSQIKALMPILLIMSQVQPSQGLSPAAPLVAIWDTESFYLVAATAGKVLVTLVVFFGLPYSFLKLFKWCLRTFSWRPAKCNTGSQTEHEKFKVQSYTPKVRTKSAKGATYFELEERLTGPRNPIESMLWPFQELESLRDQGQKFFSVDLAALASDRMLQGIVMTTDYSGMGCPEEALQQLLQAVLICTDRNQDPEVPDRCVHGNIMDRCTKKLQDRMEQARTTCLAVVLKQIENGKGKKSASVVEAGRATVRKIAKFMLCKTALRSVTRHAHCYIHDKMCPVIPDAGTGGKGLRVHVAGVNCYDWSKMGSAQGWLGQGMPIFMQWARERMVALEDVIIVECVPRFDSEMMGELFASHYNLDILQFGPTLFGEPVERPRKYMILTRKDKLQWRSQIQEFGVQDAFFRIFARTVCMEGHSKFRAPEDYVELQRQEFVKAQNMPPRTRSGKPWSFYQVASQAVRANIDDHATALVRRIGPDAAQTSWIANLRQSSSFMPAMQFTVPALLRTSRLWIFGKKRNALPLELLEVQGWNIWGSAGMNSRDAEVEGEGVEPSLPDQLRCGFVEHLHNLSSAQIFSMAGNSMHLRAIGATLLFCFGCTEPVSP